MAFGGRDGVETGKSQDVVPDGPGWNAEPRGQISHSFKSLLAQHVNDGVSPLWLAHYCSPPFAKFDVLECKGQIGKLVSYLEK